VIDGILSHDALALCSLTRSGSTKNYNVQHFYSILLCGMPVVSCVRQVFFYLFTLSADFHSAYSTTV
jgi:hypothetical protein